MPPLLIVSHFSYFDYFAEQEKRRPEEREYIAVSEVFARTLDTLSGRKNIKWDDEEREELVKSWSKMKAWEDTAQGLAKLRTKYIVYVPFNAPLGPT
jgi:2-haloacid dehalogenase